MKRVAALTFGFLAIVLAGAGTTAAAEGSYGPWEPIDQAPIAAPAGLVCPFTVTAEPVLQKLRIRYHYEDAGAVDGYQVTGPLVARITNAETEATVRENLSGLGTVTFGPDGSYDETGETISRYRTRLRVRLAVERIAGGERCLARVAAELGFADAGPPGTGAAEGARGDRLGAAPASGHAPTRRLRRLASGCAGFGRASV